MNDAFKLRRRQKGITAKMVFLVICVVIALLVLTVGIASASSISISFLQGEGRELLRERAMSYFDWLH